MTTRWVFVPAKLPAAGRPQGARKRSRALDTWRRTRDFKLDSANHPPRRAAVRPTHAAHSRGRTQEDDGGGEGEEVRWPARGAEASTPARWLPGARTPHHV